MRGIIMSGEYVVCRSEFIDTEHEARQYYQQRLAGARTILFADKSVVIVFERAANHVYTENAPEPLPTGVNLIRRRLREGVYDERVFCLDRARLMDAILPAIQRFTVSVPGKGATGREKKLLHGQRLSDGRYLRVVLGPSGEAKKWYCLSAYPVSAEIWRAARMERRAKFPP